MTTTGASFPPASSKKRSRIAGTSLPPPTMSKAPCSGPLTTGRVTAASNDVARPTASTSMRAPGQRGPRPELRRYLMSSCPPSPCGSCVLLLRRRGTTGHVAAPLDELDDVLLQRLVGGWPDVDHVTSLVVPVGD